MPLNIFFSLIMRRLFSFDLSCIIINETMSVSIENQGGYVFVVVCLFVCLLNFKTDLHEIFREGWQWPMNKWLNFGGDPDHRLDTGTAFWIRDSSLLGDMECGNGHKSAAHTDGGTGKTCLGGCMHCPRATSYCLFLYPVSTDTLRSNRNYVTERCFVLCTLAVCVMFVVVLYVFFCVLCSISISTMVKLTCKFPTI